MGNLRKISFVIDGVDFKGTVYEPRDLRTCKGILIFTHGLGYCERQYKIDGDYFADNNYLLLTYNLRGHAGNKGVWTLQDSAEDLIKTIDFTLSTYDFPNKNQLAVMGHSTGALITSLACLKDKRIKAASIITIVTCLTDSFLYWFKSGFNQEVKKYFTAKGVLPDIINRFMDDKTMLDLYRQKKIDKKLLDVPHRYGMLRSDSWNQFFHEIAHTTDIIDSADKLTLPIIFFRGEYDEVMDPEKTDLLYKKINRSQNCLKLTRSRDHFQNDSWDYIESKTIDFLNGIWGHPGEKIPKSKKSVLT